MLLGSVQSFSGFVFGLGGEVDGGVTWKDLSMEEFVMG